MRINNLIFFLSDNNKTRCPNISQNLDWEAGFQLMLFSTFLNKNEFWVYNFRTVYKLGTYFRNGNRLFIFIVNFDTSCTKTYNNYCQAVGIPIF